MFKKSLLLYFLLLATISFGVAQEDVLRPKGKPGGYGGSMYFVQPKFGFGFEVGGGANFFSMDQTWTPAAPESVWATLESGFGISPFFGFFVNYYLNDKFALELRMQYDMRTFGSKDTGIQDCLGSFVRDDIEVETDWTISGSYLNIGLNGVYEIADNVLLRAGPIILLPFDDWTMEIDREILEKGDCEFEPDGGYTMNTKGDLQDLYSIIALELGVGYRLSLTDNIDLIPQARAQIGLTKWGEDETDILDDTRFKRYGDAMMDWENKALHSVQIAVQFQYSIK